MQNLTGGAQGAQGLTGAVAGSTGGAQGLQGTPSVIDVSGGSSSSTASGAHGLPEFVRSSSSGGDAASTPDQPTVDGTSSSGSDSSQISTTADGACTLWFCSNLTMCGAVLWWLSAPPPAAIESSSTAIIEFGGTHDGILQYNTQSSVFEGCEWLPRIPHRSSSVLAVQPKRLATPWLLPPQRCSLCRPPHRSSLALRCAVEVQWFSKATL